MEEATNNIQESKQKLYFSIKEVAELVDVNISAIRFWEQQFDMIKPRKNDKGTSFYTREHIDEFLLIKHLKEEKGLTLDATYRDWETDRKSTRLNSSHITRSRMPSSA